MYKRQVGHGGSFDGIGGPAPGAWGCGRTLRLRYRTVLDAGTAIRPASGAVDRLGRDRIVREEKRHPMSESLIGKNLMEPPATRLPEEPEVLARLEAGDLPEDIVPVAPESSLVWALMAEDAWAEGRTVDSYAYARVGYHRGLDALRRAGWRGAGPVPYAHEPNRGFLRALYALGRAAAGIGESEEVERIRTFLRDSDPTAAEQIEAGQGRAQG